MTKHQLILIGVGIAAGYFLTEQISSVNIPGQPVARAYNFGASLAM